MDQFGSTGITTTQVDRIAPEIRSVWWAHCVGAGAEYWVGAVLVGVRAAFGTGRAREREDDGMFRGMYEHSIDAKGRTSLPVRFREMLARDEDHGERLIITTGMDPCLVAYPVAQWRAFEDKLAGLPQFDPAVVHLKRIYVAGATEAQIDKHGRLLIPPMLRDYAGLEGELVWAGMVTTIEIWSKDAWSQQAKALREDPKAIASALTELGL